jgi:hypothetical protein
MTKRKCLKCGRNFTPIDPRRSGKYCSLKCYRSSANRIERGTLSERFWSKVKKTKTCWIWTGMRFVGKHGDYGGIHRSNPRRMVKAHRVSWELHFGPIPEGLLVCHHCDNPPCVRPDHLFIGTHRDNVLDCERKKRHHHVNNFAGINEKRRLARLGMRGERRETKKEC